MGSGGKEKKKKEVIIPDMHLVENEMQRLGLTKDIKEKKALKEKETKKEIKNNNNAAEAGAASKAEKQERGAEEPAVNLNIIPNISKTENERKRIRNKKNRSRAIRVVIGVVIVVAAAMVLLLTEITPVLRVSGQSMESTLEDSDVVVLVNKQNLKYGDLVGFYYQRDILIKRVIALPGDVVVVGRDGSVFVNNELLEEPYVEDEALGDSDIEYPYRVGDDEYFVMGDNRLISKDSRSTAIGCVKKEQVVGKVVLRLWPLNKLSVIN